MGCLCREGAKQCIWWITREFNNTSKCYCVNPEVIIQTKIMCDGNQNRLVVKREKMYPEVYEQSKMLVH